MRRWEDDVEDVDPEDVETRFNTSNYELTNLYQK